MQIRQTVKLGLKNQ